ncbi:MAG: hypothetical protein O3B40_09770 [Actinobacteria bacterium]|nr:hypothetical protein [Actinomycetota bacterium]
MVISLIHLIATGIMTGVIWFTQIVHYPLFARIPAELSPAHAEENQRRTSWVVGLPMLAEGLCAIALFLSPPDGVSRWLPFVGGVLLAVVLISTVALQVPRHAQLATRLNQDEIDSVVIKLVRSNWIRTVGWSARTVLAAVIVSQIANS